MKTTLEARQCGEESAGVRSPFFNIKPKVTLRLSHIPKTSSLGFLQLIYLLTDSKTYIHVTQRLRLEK